MIGKAQRDEGTVAIVRPLVLDEDRPDFGVLVEPGAE
jgi:hypothetical protein